MSKIDPKEAPKGYKAVGDRGRGCKDCAFHSAAGDCIRPWDAGPCIPEQRKDGCSVIFKKAKGSKKIVKVANWKNDSIQFARLLGEMCACDCIPTGKQMEDLCESMDLRTEDIYELFNRAQDAWDKIKEAL